MTLRYLSSVACSACGMWFLKYQFATCRAPINIFNCCLSEKNYWPFWRKAFYQLADIRTWIIVSIVWFFSETSSRYVSLLELPALSLYQYECEWITNRHVHAASVTQIYQIYLDSWAVVSVTHPDISNVFMSCKISKFWPTQIWRLWKFGSSLSLQTIESFPWKIIWKA